MKIVNSMEIRKLIIKNSGFSLIEFLVGVLIFSIVFGMTIISVKLASGKVASNQNKTVSIELRNAIETINQKMNNANAKKSLNFLGSNQTIYGFKIISIPNQFPNDVLAIVTPVIQNPSGNQATCTFIAIINSRLYMKESNNCEAVSEMNDTNSNPLTSEKIKVTSLFNQEMENYFMTDNNPDKAPNVNLKIVAQDAKDLQIQFTYQTSFTMDYLTLKKLKLE